MSRSKWRSMTPSIYACMQLKEVWNMPHQTHDVERGGIGRESVEYNREVVHVMSVCPLRPRPCPALALVDVWPCRFAFNSLVVHHWGQGDCVLSSLTPCPPLLCLYHHCSPAETRRPSIVHRSSIASLVEWWVLRTTTTKTRPSRVTETVYRNTGHFYCSV